VRGISHPSAVADKVLWQESGIFTLPERIVCSFAGLVCCKEKKKKKKHCSTFLKARNLNIDQKAFA